MSIADGSGRHDMTLAFSLSAVDRLADPVAAFEDAQRWSQHVGVVDNDRDAVAETVDRLDLPQAFDLGDRDVWLAMQGIRESTDSPRYVYVGTSGEDRRIASHLGWEFVSVTEAARKADWGLVGNDPDPGLLTRLLRAVRERVGFSEW
jgi:hypothetical protein